MVKSPYVNKNRVLDRAIRTIRDLVGEDESKMIDISIVEKAVVKYNSTKHKAFDYLYSPNEVQNNPEIEEYFIRRNQEKLSDTLKKQRENKFFDYESSNILLIHIPGKKTQQKFRKGRRQFSQLVKFVRYNCGNVVCYTLVLKKNEIQLDKLIEVPVFYTRYITNNIETIPEEYLKEFLF
jgi:hypothetical protein